jgi:hypothetical protein
LVAVLAALVAAAALAGCGGGEDGTTTATVPRPETAAGPHPETTAAPTPHHAQPATAAAVTPSHCPPRLPACRLTFGRIVYVERVDPDGDGDAHFVVRDPQGVTLPGLTAIDVRVGLRPHPLPGPGDLVSAAGPVQTGSYGQSQIHALELHVAG